jgi:hypothetical protein
MKVVIHPAARKEFDRKVEYLRQNGLLPDAAELFVDEIEAALEDQRRRRLEVFQKAGVIWWRWGLTLFIL